MSRRPAARRTFGRLVCQAVLVVSGPGEHLVYGETPSDGLVFVPESEATELAQGWRALSKAQTWGEFKESVPAKWWREAVKRLLDDDGQDPPDDEFFDGMELAASIDFDWPPWLAEEMLDWVPLDIQDEFGSVGASMVSGDALGIDPSFETAVVKAFEGAGYSCRRDDDLVARASGLGSWEQMTPEERAEWEEIERLVAEQMADIERPQEARNDSERPSSGTDLEH